MLLRYDWSKLTVAKLMALLDTSHFDLNDRLNKGKPSFIEEIFFKEVVEHYFSTRNETRFLINDEENDFTILMAEDEEMKMDLFNTRHFNICVKNKSDNRFLFYHNYQMERKPFDKKERDKIKELCKEIYDLNFDKNLD